MSSDVAPLMVTSEAAHRPMTASSRIGSKGSTSAIERVVDAAGASSTSWVGVLTGGVMRSERLRLARDVLDRLVEPLRDDGARHGSRRVGAEAAVLDRDPDHNRGLGGVDEAHVPRLVVGAVEPLGRAGLAEHRVAALIPALPDVGRRAVDGGVVQAVEDRLPDGRIDRHMRRGSGLDALEQAPGAGVLHGGAEVRAHAMVAVGQDRVDHGHLQRRGLQVALADGEVDLVALGPRAVGAVGDPARVAFLLAAGRLLRVEAIAPRAVGYGAAELAGRVDAGPVAQAHAPGPLLQRLGGPGGPGRG